MGASAESLLCYEKISKTQMLNFKWCDLILQDY